jgi:hypothetical protein
LEQKILDQSIWNTEEPEAQLPIPAPDIVSQESDTPDYIDKGVSIKVFGISRYTQFRATIFYTPGLVGGKFAGRYGPGTRLNDIRSIPDREILVPYNPDTHRVVVSTKWFFAPEQDDLRTYCSRGVGYIKL